MAMSVTCTGCGSTLTVRDELLGKRIKCPKCGARFTAAEAAKQSRMKENVGGIGHRVHISPKFIAMLVAILLIPGSLLFWKLGPGKTRAQFFEMLPKMDTSIKDVIDRSLEAYLSQHDLFNPAKAHLAPHTFDVVYKLGYMPITMPAKIPFALITTQGLAVGQYDPKTEEIEADVEIGGAGNSGVLLHHGTTVIKVAGHEKGSDMVVTINGAPAVVKWPKTIEEK